MTFWTILRSALLAAVLVKAQSDASSPPVINSNFPDPGIIYSDGTWYAFATETAKSPIHVQVASSKDFKTWSLVMKDGAQYDALPNIPTWANASADSIWAPDINLLDDGTFLMYFAGVTNTGVHQNPLSSHCIGYATSKTALGPYTVSNDLLICPGNSLGAFDASGFKDWKTKGDWTLPAASSKRWSKSRVARQWTSTNTNSYTNPQYSEGGEGGNRYIVYKEQNADMSGSSTTLTPLILQQVDSDGITCIGDPVTLLNNNGASDQDSIEAPVIVKSANAQTYWLFFSRGNTFDANYTVSYAKASSVTGPYTRMGNLLQTGSDSLNSPGGADILWDGKHMMFHAIDEPVGTKWMGVRAAWSAVVSITYQAVSLTMLY